MSPLRAEGFGHSGCDHPCQRHAGPSTAMVSTFQRVAAQCLPVLGFVFVFIRHFLSQEHLGQVKCEPLSIPSLCQLNC